MSKFINVLRRFKNNARDYLLSNFNQSRLVARRNRGLVHDLQTAVVSLAGLRGDLNSQIAKMESPGVRAFIKQRPELASDYLQLQHRLKQTDEGILSLGRLIIMVQSYKDLDPGPLMTEIKQVMTSIYSPVFQPQIN